MASFAKIGLNSKVIEVQSVVNEVLHDSNGVEQENIGIDFLTKLTGWSIWKQTSYNTIGGVHKLGGTPLRKNYAGIGFTYDEDRDAFISPKPYASWVLNEETCQWEAPVALPDTENRYNWNEETQQWNLDE
mgnify:CR=1 FL=1|jgi:hypothetical protein|tara:strand:+ start:365 stop:757 length:393 start_codon:yes stop_codon:yes gene_type:complete